MDIVIDLTPIMEFLALPPDEMALRLLVLFGWIPVAITLLWGIFQLWMDHIQGGWGSKQKYVLLAVDIPRGNERSPRAVEDLFNYLHGAQSNPNLIERYWVGVYQLAISFEVVSIDGYTQFLIRTPVNNKNLVESAVYAQYPDAEIAEVDDYVTGMPTKFPDDDYDVFGWDFFPAKNQVYPIKTYKEFEHQLSPLEATFKDPMASLMDLCSSLKKGEQFWSQIVVVPIPFDWTDEGNKEIGKIMGEKAKTTLLNDKIDKFMELISDLSEYVVRLWDGIESKKEESSAKSMQELRPKEKKQIEAITEKVSKVGYKCKVRMVYLAKKEVMNKPKVASGFAGYMKQFVDLDLNNLRPDMSGTATSVSYFFVKNRLNKRKNKIVKNYMKRSASAGKTPGILNVEELATLWHFPIESAVKAPLIQKTPGKKSEPPMSLPVGDVVVSESLEDAFSIKKTSKKTKESGVVDISKELGLSDEQSFEEELDLDKKLADDKKQDETGKSGAPPGNLPIS